jgi:hypothetical protein
MICLPCIGRHQGVSLHCAPAGANPTLTKLFAAMGGGVSCESEDEMNTLMVVRSMTIIFLGHFLMCVHLCPVAADSHFNHIWTSIIL